MSGRASQGSPPRAASTNSQLPTTFSSPWEVRDAGVDSVTYAFWAGSDVARALAFGRFDWTPLAGRRITVVREARDAHWLDAHVGGLKLGAYIGAGKLVAEGRLGAICAGSTEATELGAPSLLTLGASRAKAAFTALGLVVGNAAVVRVDLAADLLFADRLDGLRFTNAWAAGVRAPGYKQRVTESADGLRVEAVEWTRGASIAARLYDAGTRHGTHPAGVRVRFERQVRFRKSAAKTPEQLRDSDLRQMHVGLLRRPLALGVKVRVASRARAEEIVWERKRAGELSDAKAERLIGTLGVLANGWAHDWTPRKRRDRLAELRGLELAVDFSRRAEDDMLDLGPQLHALANTEAWAWAK